MRRARRDGERGAVTIERAQSLASVGESVAGRGLGIRADACAVIFDRQLQRVAVAPALYFPARWYARMKAKHPESVLRFV